MFTGLIETICTVKSVRRSAGAMQLTIDLGKLAPASNKRGQADDSKIGDSIAINGACLTVSKLESSLATFELSVETLAKSTLGKLMPPSEVNVERAMKAADRFGGHIVQGHVDGTATIKTIERLREFADFRFATEAELLEQMIAKGSVAVDGISLTIARADETGFSVVLIPETLKRTTLGKARIGDEVNVETDIIVKTIKKQLEKILPQTEPLTAERLRQLGF